VALLTVNGWRKFYLLSRDAAHTEPESLSGHILPYAPVGSPGAAVLKALTAHGFPALSLSPLEPRQLELALLAGRYDAALVPEPQATILMSKDPRLRVIAGVEDICSRLTGGPARLPLACLAVNTRTASLHPALVRRLVEILVDEGRRIKADPERGLAALPREFESYIPRELIRRSLARDMILVEPASAVSGEIRAFLGMMDGETLGGTAAPDLPPDFLWH
jgi:NitT/TauT family transport system substrate-binding protein